jgi:octaprenyl-diphosphate synthase
MQVIANKTARLFQAAAEVTTMICQRSLKEQDEMAKYGFHLGMAFQLVDDALDYMGSSDELGKNIGDDLAEGKPTLPLIHAMNHTTGKNAELIKESIRTGGISHLPTIITAIKEANSLAYTLQKAREQIELALASITFLNDSVYRQALEAIAEFTIERSS